MSFKAIQIRVAMGMGCGALLTLLALFWPDLPSVSSDVQARLSLWFSCSLLCSLWLVISIARLARHRFFTPEDISGAGLMESSTKAAQLQAQIQNTLEQAVLAVIGYGAWIWLGPPDRVGLVIVFSTYFSVGRLIFFVGYAHGAPARALGFALTFYPTVVLCLLTLPAAISRIANL